MFSRLYLNNCLALLVQRLCSVCDGGQKLVVKQRLVIRMGEVRHLWNLTEGPHLGRAGLTHFLCVLHLGF